MESTESKMSPVEELTKESAIRESLAETTEKYRHVRFCEELLRIIASDDMEAAEKLFKQLEGKSINLDTAVNYRTALLGDVSSGRVRHRAIVDPTDARFTYWWDGLPKIALQVACREPHLEVAKILLKAGADVNKRDWKYRSALGLAIASGSTELVNLLLTNGAAIKVKWVCYLSPLYAAIRSLTGKNLELMVLTLLRHGVPVNAVDESGCPVLYTTLRRSEHGTSRLLIECGALTLGGWTWSSAPRYERQRIYMDSTAKSDATFDEWIEKQLTATPSLQSICGRVIRLHLVKTHQRSILGHLKKLPLPKTLIEELTLERFVKQASLAD